MNLRRKLLAFLKSQKKGAEYTELEYLESTGTQWIDTGLIANQLIDKTIYIKMKNTGNSGNYAYNGAYDVSGTGLTVQFGLYATSDTQCRTTQNYFDPSYSQTTGLDKSLFYELQMDKTTYWLNGEVVGTHAQTDEEKIKTCVNPFLIFGRSQKNAPNSITPMAISRFWIKNADGSYMMDLIPVLDKDFTPCMYDKVTGKYFYNQGDGEFKWKLPNQLEYLESDGNQYILTDYYPNSNTAIEVDYLPNPSSAFTVIYGSLENSNANKFHTVISSTNYCLQVNSHNGSGYYGLNGNGKFVYGDQEFIREQIRVVLTVDNYNKVVKTLANGQTVNYDMTSVSGLGEVNCVYPLIIFNRINGGVVATANGYEGKMYSYKIWESDKLLHYYIPAFDENLNVCMYDLVSKTYLYNQGSGTFKGFFEDGSQLVGYLESIDEQYIDTLLPVTENTGAFIDAEWAYENKAFSTLSGSYQSFMVMGIVPSSRRICYSYNSNPTGTTSYPLKDGTFVPSNETSSVDSSKFITENGRFKVGLNYLESGKWTYETASENYETDLGGAVVQNNNTITLFGRRYSATPQESNSYLWKGKIYSAKFTEGDKIVRHFVPVVKSDNTACMYDLVSKKYFVNQGSGSFTYE